MDKPVTKRIYFGMVREFNWDLSARSYETDAWGFVSTAGILRYLEQSAVSAAADAGYGGEFHRENNSAWVVRRLTLLLETPIPRSAHLSLTTWLSHMVRVWCGREYKIKDAGSGALLCTSYTEWVYLNRDTLAPMPIPKGLITDFDLPGAPVQQYDPPQVEPLAEGQGAAFTVQREAQWVECDSMGHINNAVYADWLDEAVYSAVETLGISLMAIRGTRVHPRGEYYNMNYRRAVLPGDSLSVTTRIVGLSGRLFSVDQTITLSDGTEAMTAANIYGWRQATGSRCQSPEGWEEAVRRGSPV